MIGSILIGSEAVIETVNEVPAGPSADRRSERARSREGGCPASVNPGMRSRCR